MKITADQRGQVTLVAIEGSVDALTAGEVTNFLNARIGAGGYRLVADLSRLEYISSAGLRAILAALKEARRAGGDLRLAAAQDNVQRLLNMAGFTSIVKFYTDVDAAVASFTR